MFTDRRWHLVLATAVVLVALEAAVLFWPHRAPSANGWLRRTRIDVAGESIVAQTFVPHVDGLAAVKVFARASGSDVQASMRLQLSEVVGEQGEQQVPVYARDVPIAQLGNGGTLVYRFPEIADSAERRYRLAISVPNAAEGHGVSLEIIKGDSYHDGELTYNDVPRWADLRFDAEAHPRTYASRFLAHAARRQSAVALPMVAALAWLGAHVFAVGAVLMLAGSRDSPPSPQ